MKPRFLTPEPTESEIQHAAFYLWEEQGRPCGRDLEIWLAAKERLKHRLAAPAGRTRGPGKAAVRPVRPIHPTSNVGR